MKKDTKRCSQCKKFFPKWKIKQFRKKPYCRACLNKDEYPIDINYVMREMNRTITYPLFW